MCVVMEEVLMWMVMEDVDAEWMRRVREAEGNENIGAGATSQSLA